MSFSKEYFEIAAALYLIEIEFLSGPFGIEWIKDKPDIQLPEIGIGIEVGRDILQETGQQQHIWNQTHGKSLKEKREIIARKDKKQKFQSRFSEDKSWMCFQTNRYELLINTIKNKQIKFKGYKKFNQNLLFIHSDVFALDVKEESKLAEILSSVDNEFNIIFIKYYNRIFKWENEELNSYMLNDKALSKVKQKAQKLAEEYIRNKDKSRRKHFA